MARKLGNKKLKIVMTNVINSKAPIELGAFGDKLAFINI